MTDRVCVVVGIGPKNGASFARTFSAAGYRVALLSRGLEFSSKLAEELPGARAYACDVSDPAAVERAFVAVRADLGEVDVLVYNAGSGTWGHIEEIAASDFERSWRVNAMGLFLCSQQVVPSMRQRSAGAIVVVGATASLRGKPFTTAFAPAKAAQRSLAQAMARHLWPAGVHVALLIIDGGIGEPGGDSRAALDPDQIAKSALALTEQHPSAWSFEVDLRPAEESW